MLSQALGIKATGGTTTRVLQTPTTMRGTGYRPGRTILKKPGCWVTYPAESIEGGLDTAEDITHNIHHATLLTTSTKSLHTPLTLGIATSPTIDDGVYPHHGRVVHTIRKGRHCWTTYPVDNEATIVENTESHQASGETLTPTAPSHSLSTSATTPTESTGTHLPARIVHKKQRNGRHSWTTYPVDVATSPMEVKACADKVETAPVPSQIPVESTSKPAEALQQYSFKPSLAEWMAYSSIYRIPASTSKSRSCISKHVISNASESAITKTVEESVSSLEAVSSMETDILKVDASEVESSIIESSNIESKVFESTEFESREVTPLEMTSTSSNFRVPSDILDTQYSVKPDAVKDQLYSVQTKALKDVSGSIFGPTPHFRVPSKVLDATYSAGKPDNDEKKPESVDIKALKDASRRIVEPSLSQLCVPAQVLDTAHLVGKPDVVEKQRESIQIQALKDTRSNIVEPSLTHFRVPSNVLDATYSMGKSSEVEKKTESTETKTLLFGSSSAIQRSPGHFRVPTKALDTIYTAKADSTEEKPTSVETEALIHKPSKPLSKSEQWIQAGLVALNPNVYKSQASYSRNHYYPYKGPVKNRNLFYPRDVPEVDSWETTIMKVDERTFHKFPILPVELQEMIIEHSLVARRVTIKPKLVFGRDARENIRNKDKTRQQKFSSPAIQPPSALFVCKQFRNIALKHYQKFFGVDGAVKNLNWLDVNYTIPRRWAPSRIYFNPSIDTLVLDLTNGRHFLHAAKEIPVRQRQAIKKLAIRYDAFECNLRLRMANNPHLQCHDFEHGVASFPNLEQLDMLVPKCVEGDYDEWRDQSTEMGNKVRSHLRAFRKKAKLLRDEPDVYDDDRPFYQLEFPEWQPPYTVRTVLLHYDGLPSFDGIEEYFLVRKEKHELREAEKEILRKKKDEEMKEKREAHLKLIEARR